MSVSDDDVTGPTITDIQLSEEAGDGAGCIEDNELVSITWSLSDESGIGATSCVVDGVEHAAEGEYWVIVGPLETGEHTFFITATDKDNSPETTESEHQDFEVIQHAPTVLDVFPQADETDVSVGVCMTADFDLALDPASVNGDTVFLIDSEGQDVRGDVTYDGLLKQLRFCSSENLSNSETYSMTLKGGPTGILDANGNSLESDFVWSFTTEADAVLPTAIITSPAGGEELCGSVLITGTAWDLNFLQYQLFFGLGASPVEWFPISDPVMQPVLSGLLGVFDLDQDSPADGGLFADEVEAARLRAPPPSEEVCASCGQEMDARAVLCVACGFDRRTQERLVTKCESPAEPAKPKESPASGSSALQGPTILGTAFLGGFYAYIKDYDIAATMGIFLLFIVGGPILMRRVGIRDTGDDK